MKAHWRHRHLKDWAELEHPKCLRRAIFGNWMHGGKQQHLYRDVIVVIARDMYAVRAAHQKVLIEIHNEKSVILLEAERREALRAEEHKKIEATIMLQCLYRMLRKKSFAMEWQGDLFCASTKYNRCIECDLQCIHGCES